MVILPPIMLDDLVITIIRRVVVELETFTDKNLEVIIKAIIKVVVI